MVSSSSDMFALIWARVSLTHAGFVREQTSGHIVIKFNYVKGEVESYGINLGEHGRLSNTIDNPFRHAIASS